MNSRLQENGVNKRGSSQQKPAHNVSHKVTHTTRAWITLWKTLWTGDEAYKYVGQTSVLYFYIFIFLRARNQGAR